jgi:hypothetical protein
VIWWATRTDHVRRPITDDRFLKRDYVEVGSLSSNSVLMCDAEADELVPVSVNVSPVAVLRTFVLKH